jgi:hypothetical protein
MRGPGSPCLDCNGPLILNAEGAREHPSVQMYSVITQLAAPNTETPPVRIVRFVRPLLLRQFPRGHQSCRRTRLTSCLSYWVHYSAGGHRDEHTGFNNSKSRDVYSNYARRMCDFRVFCLPVYTELAHLRFNPLKTEFLHNFIYKSSLYLTENTLLHCYKTQPVNAVWRKSHCLL